MQLKFRWALFLFCLGLCSCSIQKRHYREGITIQWKKNRTSEGQTSGIIFQELVASDEPVLAVAGVGPEILDIGGGAAIAIAGQDSCDIIIFRDGKKEKAKVIEVGKEIRYTRCDMPAGPVFAVYKRDVELIAYASGATDFFKAEPQLPPLTVSATPELNESKHSEKTLYLPAPLSLMASICSMFLPFPFGAVFGFVAFAVAMYALVNIISNKERYRGMVYAIIALLIGGLVAIIQGLNNLGF